MALAIGPRENRLLASLPDETLAGWLPHLEPVEMQLGKVLYEPGSHAAARLLSHLSDRFPAVCDGGRRLPPR